MQSIAVPRNRNAYVDPWATNWEDPVVNEPYRGLDKWAATRSLALSVQKKHGSDGLMAFWKQQEEAPDYEEGKTDYTNWEKTAMADQLLRESIKVEHCRECQAEGIETGEIIAQPVLDDDDEVVLNDDGEAMMVEFPAVKCENGHQWLKGEGKARGIDGENPILFEEHIQARRRREIYTSVGTPDPSIKAGIYNRTHPQGRKVNSPDQRKRNGASFFR